MKESWRSMEAARAERKRSLVLVHRKGRHVLLSNQ